MKILLVYTNTYDYIAPPPIGIAFLAGALLQTEHEVKITDLMFDKEPNNTLVKVLDEYKPDLAGFSVHHLDNQCMTDPVNPLSDIKQYVKAAKDRDVITMLGDTGFSCMPAEMLKYMEADYGIRGQGETSFISLIDSLEKGETDKSIQGLVCRDGNGKILINPPDFSGYENKNPDWSMLDSKKYKKKLFPGLYPASVVTKSGCCFNCAFCNSRYISGSRFKFRKIDDIIKDIRHIKNSQNIEILFFADTCFNYPLDFSKEALRGIIDSRIKIRFMTNLVPGKGMFDDEYFSLYRKAGGIYTVLGCDSLCDKMLKNYNKVYRYNDVLECSRMLNRHGIPFQIDLLFGGPGEAEDTVKESMNNLGDINFALCLYTLGIRIEPNTEIERIAMEQGIIDDRADLLFPEFYFSKDLDLNWADSYIKKSIKRYRYRFAKMAPVAVKHFISKKIK